MALIFEYLLNGAGSGGTNGFVPLSGLLLCCVCSSHFQGIVEKERKILMMDASSHLF